MGWSDQNIIAQLVIVEGPGDGLFVYNGTPALGNLVASIASTAGADQFGNAYQAGFTTYKLGDNTIFAQLTVGSPGAFLQMQSGSTSAAPMQIRTGPDGTGSELTISTEEYPADGGAYQLNLFSPAAGGLMSWGGTAIGTSLLETLILGVPETWHSISSLSNGWTGTIRYRLRAENEVSLQADVITPGTLTSGTTLATLPAGYRPASEQRFTYTNSGTITAPQELYGLLVTTGGAIQLAGGPTGLLTMSFNARIPLD